MHRIPDILESARHVVERAAHVRIDHQAAVAWARDHAAAEFRPPGLPAELEFAGDRDQCANLALLLSCLNFCFWSEQPWSVTFRGTTWRRTMAMYAAVLRAVEEDRSWLTPQRWAAADHEVVLHLFRGEGLIPMFEQRVAVLNETGQCLATTFGGQFSRAIDSVGHDARRLAYLLAEHFPSFRDVATYHDRTVAFLKRAQICAAEVHRLWTRNRHPSLNGLEQLTLFADYRLPQYLRHAGILELAPDLAADIDQRRTITAGSSEEIELRAATITAGELIIRHLSAVPMWRLDFLLWQRSHYPEVRVEHHRTLTVYY